VAIFDRLVLLGKGQLVYSGEMERAQHHFEKIGHPCPPGYNIADYLIDLTVEASGDGREVKDPVVPVNGHAMDAGRNAENGLARSRLHDDSSDDDDESIIQHRPHQPLAARRRQLRKQLRPTYTNQIKAKAAKLLGAFTPSKTKSENRPSEPTQIPEKLASLVLACRASDDAKIVEAEIGRIQSGQTPGGAGAGAGAVLGTGERGEALRGYQKAGVWEQFKLLSGRAFKNLYR
jgi:hypothetical protein